MQLPIPQPQGTCNIHRTLYHNSSTIAGRKKRAERFIFVDEFSNNERRSSAGGESTGGASDVSSTNEVFYQKFNEIDKFAQLIRDEADKAYSGDHKAGIAFRKGKFEPAGRCETDCE